MPYLPELTPPARLKSAVLLRISRAHIMYARLKLGGFLFVSALLGLGLAGALQYAAYEFYASGFYSYVTLFFDSAARAYWSDLLLTLAESLPSLALLLLLAATGAFVWSAARTVRTARAAFPLFITQ